MLGAVIYSTLSETPLPGGRVIVCMQMLIILSCPEFGMWIIPPVQWRSRREEREREREGERGEIGIPQVPRTPLLASH